MASIHLVQRISSCDLIQKKIWRKNLKPLHFSRNCDLPIRFFLFFLIFFDIWHLISQSYCYDYSLRILLLFLGVFGSKIFIYAFVFSFNRYGAWIKIYIRGLKIQKDIRIKTKRNNKRIKEKKDSTKIKKWLPERLIHLYYVQWYQGITATT